MYSETYVKFEHPLRGDVVCRNCGGEIEAIAETHTSVAMKGLRWFSWRHVRTGINKCTKTFDAEPYDDWEATRKIENAGKGG